MFDRRSFLEGGAASAFATLASVFPGTSPPGDPRPTVTDWNRLLGPAPGRDRGRPVGFHTPDVEDFPHELDGDVKVFRLVADVTRRSFLPGRTFDVWGYNGSMPGPTIQVNQGDRVRILFENRLPEITSMHWHGLEVPNAMDGVPGVTQDPVAPGETFTYEFTLDQNGTFFYHSHMPMQEMMGMVGFFIVHPRREYQPAVDKDFGLILQEWAVLPNNTVPNSLAMEFNWLTLNGRSGPHTTPLIVRLGERVRIRFVNLGMDHHPMHIHGHTWVTTGTEGGRIPESAWAPGNTELVGVAQARDVEFVANNPGDWMLHCHLPHHMMNHMASMVGPVTEDHRGMHTGGGMEEGMGMSSGGALSDDNGPSMGRAIGLGAMRDRPVTNLPLTAPRQEPPHRAPATGRQGQHEQHDHGDRPPRQQGPVPGKVPGYPQDHFMAIDDRVAKPETYGMRPTWSGGVMGMMTVVRVLEPDLYDRIQELRRRESASRGGRR